MPIKNVYVPDDEMEVWNEVTDLAARHKTSVSKLVIGEMKRMLRERRKGTGLPLGFAVPASMKDPRVLRAEETADRVRAIVLDALLAADEVES